MRQAMIEVIGADRLLYGDNFGGSDAIREDLPRVCGSPTKTAPRSKARTPSVC